MILLAAHEVTRQFDTEPILREITFEVRPGERIGLVGPNGTGKTTLLRILAGLDEPDAGTVERHPNSEIVLLEQKTEFTDDQTLHSVAKAGLASLYQLQHEMLELTQQLAKSTDTEVQSRLHRRYDQLHDKLDRLDAFHIDHRIDEVLQGLGFQKEDYPRPMSTFSGGQQNRCLLAKLLLQAPEVMLLDEPTNHLDIETTEWLEGYLNRTQQAMIIVSHDRYFLDRVTNRTLELYASRIEDYKGNFSAYWRQREERNALLRKTYEKQQDFIEKTEEFIRRNFYGQKSAQAHDREKKLARLEQVDLPRDIVTFPMSFPPTVRSGDWTIDVEHLTQGYDRPLMEDFSLMVERGARLGILGPNGCGKTTLLKTLIGELTPQSGKVRLGTNVKIAYFDQQLMSVDSDANAIEAIRPPDQPEIMPAHLRDILARFGIRGELALQAVGYMSGGERCKVALAKVAALKANLLVLDEPTNHLDLWARDALEQALQSFDGTLLFVSHDRYFLDRVAQHVLVFEPDRLRYFEGNYSGYLAFVQNQQREISAVSPELRRENRTTPNKPDLHDNESASASKRKRKYPYRKVHDIEDDIARHESLIAQCEDDLANPEYHRDGQRLREITSTYEQAKEELAQLYEHWEEAMELN
ncbi:MAG: ABC-F family ATP-binding cassette domain-containing protein [Planctomycetota bacterium]|nr:ABC-F family ATP-binding cassette domain-containing protein [Planctomycetota bacterium]MDA1214136.1 ABC-F family ATP-binding cassette domain-containing protein [Planctomycetota bacterium]